MKGRIWLFCLSVMVLGVSNVRLAAQSPCFTFSSNYADYESAWASSDGTAIYTSVSVDGYGNMTFFSGNGCSGINYGSITHTPSAVNVIVSPDGTSAVGGQIYGSSGCPTCYISVENDQEVTNVNPGDVYTFNYATLVICSLGGSIYSTSSWWTVSIAQTYGQWVVGAPAGSCNYNAACTNTSTPKCGSHGWTEWAPKGGCSAYIWVGWLAIGYPSGAKSCIGLSTNGLPVTGPGPCTPQ